MKNNSAPVCHLLAWHYTTGDCFKEISQSGVLMPSSILVVPPEKPVVWFSTNQSFEPTAMKGMGTPEGLVRTTTMRDLDEVGQHAGGWVRLGIERKKLRGPRELFHFARIHRETWSALARAGARDGANHQEWMGHIGELPLDDLRVEFMNPDRSWGQSARVLSQILRHESTRGPDLTVEEFTHGIRMYEAIQARN